VNLKLKTHVARHKNTHTKNLKQQNHKYDACMKVLGGETLLNFVPVFNNSGIPQPHITFRQCFVRKAHFSRKSLGSIYEGWNFNSGNYLFTTDTK